MAADTAQCSYPGCSNAGERRLIARIMGLGNGAFSVTMCDAHYDLRDIDDDVISWLKEELQKQL
jgi:hypothetical protein